VNSTDSSKSPKRRWPRIVGLFGIAIAVLVVITAVTIWRAPIWFGLELAGLELHAEGMHGHSATIDGVQIHYIEGGSGEPLVLVHGLGGSSRQDWLKLAPYFLRSGHHVYAMDLPGFGQSARPADRSYSIAEQARFVEVFMDATHLNSVALGGESMGGWIAARVAIDQPRRISRLVLFDSAGMKFDLGFDPILFTPETREQAAALAHLVSSRSRPMPGFVADDLVRTLQRDSWIIKRALISMKSNVDIMDQNFSSLKMPLLLVWGKDDLLTPLSVGERMHEAAPQSVLEVYDGCGHIALLDCSDRVGPNVVKFLNGSGPEPGSTLEVPAP